MPQCRDVGSRPRFGPQVPSEFGEFVHDGGMRVHDPNRPLVSVGYRVSEISTVGYVRQDPATTVRPDHPELVGNRHRVMPASSSQFFTFGHGHPQFL
jgi:hypothetical protein